MSKVTNVVLCGTGFIGSHVARAFTRASQKGQPVRITVASRNPKKMHEQLSREIPDFLSSPASIDITEPNSLRPVIANADIVVSLVGILMGTPEQFQKIQVDGARNVATAAQEAGAKLIHISAIGADSSNELISPRTKGLGEEAVFQACPSATIFRPSLVFGPGDSFFARFATLSQFLPFMPVFGGGHAKFQPVYVEDLAGAIVLCGMRDPNGINTKYDGKIIEAGGPEVFTYREIMELVLKYTGRWRPILSLPFSVGLLQASVLERLPPSVLSLSRDQVRQLSQDNVVSSSASEDFPELLNKYAGIHRASVHEILPKYL